jgi:hypothetical protein
MLDPYKKDGPNKREETKKKTSKTKRNEKRKSEP